LNRPIVANTTLGPRQAIENAGRLGAPLGLEQENPTSRGASLLFSVLRTSNQANPLEVDPLKSSSFGCLSSVLIGQIGNNIRGWTIDIPRA
jgi:hypothetical protein